MQVPIKTIEREVTKLVPYRLPGDTLAIQALFECDSANNVLMTSLEETRSQLSTAFKFKDGVLDYNAAKHSDTVWLPVDSVIIERDVPVLVEVPKIEYRQTQWQQLRAKIGDIALIALALLGIWKVIKRYLKII